MLAQALIMLQCSSTSTSISISTITGNNASISIISPGNATLNLIADTHNGTTEDCHPIINFSQDGGGVLGSIGMGLNNLSNNYMNFISTEDMKFYPNDATEPVVVFTSGGISSISFNATSDYRIKNNVKDLNATYTVDNLRPKIYTNSLLEKTDIGLIAHELQEHYPFLVNGIKDGEPKQSVNYTGLIGILIKEIQELKKRVLVLEEKKN